MPVSDSKKVSDDAISCATFDVSVHHVVGCYAVRIAFRGGCAYGSRSVKQIERTSLKMGHLNFNNQMKTGHLSPVFELYMILVFVSVDQHS